MKKYIQTDITNENQYRMNKYLINNKNQVVNKLEIFNEHFNIDGLNGIKQVVIFSTLGSDFMNGWISEPCIEKMLDGDDKNDVFRSFIEKVNLTLIFLGFEIEEFEVDKYSIASTLFDMSKNELDDVIRDLPD